MERGTSVAVRDAAGNTIANGMVTDILATGQIVVEALELTDSGGVQLTRRTLPPTDPPSPVVVPRGIAIGFAPDGTVGVAYRITPQPFGGPYPYTNFEVIAGALPDGLELGPNEAAGNRVDIAGTPTVAAEFNPRIRCLDDAGNAIEEQLTITINAAPSP